jgi:hypothetical protein
MTELNLTRDRRAPTDRMRWWLPILFPALIGGLTGYVSAYTQTQTAIATLQEREANHYAELHQSLDLLRADVRDLRNEIGAWRAEARLR